MIDIFVTGKGYGVTGLSGSGGPPNPMDVVFRILGEIVIENMADVLHMNPP